jgi:hypothetical protein
VRQGLKLVRCVNASSHQASIYGDVSLERLLAHLRFDLVYWKYKIGKMRFLNFLRADLMNYSLVSILGISAAILLSLPGSL